MNVIILQVNKRLLLSLELLEQKRLEMRFAAPSLAGATWLTAADCATCTVCRFLCCNNLIKGKGFAALIFISTLRSLNEIKREALAVPCTQRFLRVLRFLAALTRSLCSHTVVHTPYRFYFAQSALSSYQILTSPSLIGMSGEFQLVDNYLRITLTKNIVQQFNCLLPTFCFVFTTSIWSSN